MHSVEDRELLFRSVAPDSVSWQGKNWRLSSQAFNDRQMQPSVDRRQLCGTPEATKQGVGDGVVQLRAGEIRKSVRVSCESGVSVDQARKFYSVDVTARPLPDNAAHAQIEADPEISSKGHFRRIKEALCRLAEQHNWAALPNGAPAGTQCQIAD